VPRVSRILLYLTVFASVLGAGLAHGLITDRWGPPDTGGKEALARVPTTIGDWDGTPIELDPNQLPVTDPGEMLLRRYVNRVTGSSVTLFLTVGRPGPVATSHTPESCYPGAGFSYAVPTAARSIPTGPDGRPQQFRVATFSKTETASPLHVRVFWSWSATGAWQTPAYPRLTFARQRRLYKLYVIRPLLRPTEPLDDDPALSFIQALVPELDRALFAGPRG
jgi:hypothetical protein